MPAPVRTPRTSWIEEGLKALAAGGPDGVRVETLAKSLGVTKGGFYGHFDDRGALLVEMLDTWEHLFIDEVIERVEAGGGDARDKLRRLWAIASEDIVELAPGIQAHASELMRIELAIRDWARRDPAVARRLKRIDDRRLEYLRVLYGEFCPDEKEVEVRAMTALSLWIADQLIAADHGPYSRAEFVDQAIGRLRE